MWELKHHIFFDEPSNKQILSKKKVNQYNTVHPRFRWGHSKFYLQKHKISPSPFFKKHIYFRKLNLNFDEVFSFRFLINNFCLNGQFLKYFIYFSDVFLRLRYIFNLSNLHTLITPTQHNNLIFLLSNFKTNLLLKFPTYLLYFIFIQNEVLFFAKAVKLKRVIAKRLKRKYTLEYFYVPSNKRLLKTFKLWKYYAKSIKKSKFPNRLIKGLLNLILEYKDSFLSRYKAKIIKKLIRQKKLEI